MLSSSDRQDAVIGKVYDAALDGRLWRGLAGEIATAFEGSSAAVQVRSAAGATHIVDCTPNIDEQAQRKYEQYYWQTDVWAGSVIAKGLGRVFVGEEVASPGELRRTEFYADWLRSCAQFHVVGSVFEIGPGELGVLGIHRAEGMNAYSVEEKLQVQAFLPHLVRGLQLRRRLQSAELAQELSLETLDRLNVALFVVGTDGHVLLANSRASTLTTAHGCLRVLRGKLVAQAPAAQKQLAAAIHRASALGHGESCFPSRSFRLERPERLPISLTVQPLRTGCAGVAPSPCALVFVTDPEQQEPKAGILQELFGFTPAEAVVASRLAAGQALEIIASELGVTENTVRTHVKRLFLKTDTTRQGELISLVLRSLGPGRTSPI